ncbi:hypothetical protein NM208_g10268 [Fusarium decemcellulare]|uniref:Uncharacterized protein n=1 Tax=Fusarium decemcellulare TaxID=57161 RepID=A0ACC1RYN9_9HYPO|nr:hypothetical protein NM208_g10268 [Fusarium decemcellulare]
MAPITIRGNTLDPAKPPAGLNLIQKTANKNYILIQLKEELSQDGIDSLRTRDVTVIKKVDKYTWMCHSPAPNFDKFKSLPFIQSVLEYLPFFKIRDSLKQQIAKSGANDLFHVGFALHAYYRTKQQTDDILQQVIKIVKDAASSARGGGLIEIDIAARHLEAIAAIDAVEAIEEVYESTLLNDEARQLIGIESFNDAFKKVKENKNKQPFTGRGQIIAVADSGIDPDHPSFADNAIVGANDYLYDMFLPNKQLTDHHGHGTHVAATIVGRKFTSQGKNIMGMAPGAQVVPQAWRGDDNLPAGSRTKERPDVRNLFEKPYEDHNARIHNNSHGSMVKGPDGSETQPPYGALDAAVVDEAVCKYPELLIVFAAGNAGVATTITSQIGAYAAAKNCITVGACFSSRPVSLINDKLKYDESNKNPPTTDQVPKFSSKGPTVEGRIKPDLVAPGVSILSALSSKIGTDTRETIPPTRVQDWQNRYGVIDAKGKTNTSMLHNGTSMAAPVVSGAAALVREALIGGVEKKPTSALVKALLIHGATYLGDDKTQYGYGRLNVETSLQLAQAMPVSGFIQGTFKKKDKYPVNIQKWTTDSKLKVTLVYIDAPGERINNRVFLRYKVGGEEKNTATSLDTVQQVVVEKIGSSTAPEVWVEAERCISDSPYAIVWSFESVK